MAVAKMKYLNKFNSIKEFKKYIEEELNIENWFIMNLPIQERIDTIRNKKYFTSLQELAKKQKINASDIEILSWLDTLNQLYYTLDDMVESDLQIFQELEIPFSKKRIDYLLCHNNRILILEYSLTNYKEETLSYDNKLLQAIRYKELLKNLLPDNIKIGIYVFLMKNEMTDYKIIKQQSKYCDIEVTENFDKQIDLYEFINYYFYNAQRSAHYELLKCFDTIQNDFKYIKKSFSE